MFLANFVEWAIEESLPCVYLHEQSSSNGETIASAGSKLWDLDESNRFVKLAEHFPELLTYDEQLIWRVICDYSEQMDGFNEPIRLKTDSRCPSKLIRRCWSKIESLRVGYRIKGGPG